MAKRDELLAGVMTQIILAVCRGQYELNAESILAFDDPAAEPVLYALKVLRFEVEEKGRAFGDPNTYPIIRWKYALVEDAAHTIHGYPSAALMRLCSDVFCKGGQPAKAGRAKGSITAKEALAVLAVKDERVTWGLEMAYRQIREAATSDTKVNVTLKTPLPAAAVQCIADALRTDGYSVHTSAGSGVYYLHIDWSNPK